MNILRLTSLDGHADITVDPASLILVGSHSFCDVRIASMRVSRLHCCLGLCDDGLMIRDLGSTNGTQINDQRVKTGCLNVRDELAIAHLRYRLQFEQVRCDELLTTVGRDGGSCPTEFAEPFSLP
jgi:pSer/pThr/pTyr-binding forkhead associated (FHA) protein